MCSVICKAVQRLFVTLEDCHEQISRKTILFTVSLACTVIGILQATNAGFSPALAAPLLYILLSTATLTHLLAKRPATDLFIECVLFTVAIANILFDVSSLSRGNRVWAVNVLVLDLALVCRLKSQRLICIVLPCMILWSIIAAIETTARFGITEVTSDATQQELYEEVCDCATLPCARPPQAAAAYMTGTVCVLLLDFYFTRGFASQVLAEKEKVVSVLSLAEVVGNCLLRFDTDEAEALLQKASCQASSCEPCEMVTVLQRLVGNLKLYRPYLPDSLFEKLRRREVCRDDSCCELSYDSLEQYHAQPPGVGDGTNAGNVKGEVDNMGGGGGGGVAVLFTDIQSSTAIWDMCPSGMQKALAMHNTLLRKTLRQYNGYEVKTIGDSFMIAFETLSSAVRFGLEVQTELPQLGWPEELLCAPHYENSSKVDSPSLREGLRVRIGVHFGEVRVERNVVTGRYDYFGTTVNKAARLEGAGVAHAVTLTEDSAKRVEAECAALPCLRVALGKTSLKGLSDESLIALLPQDEEMRKTVEASLHIHKAGASGSGSGSVSGSYHSVGHYPKSFGITYSHHPAVTTAKIDLYTVGDGAAAFGRLKVEAACTLGYVGRSQGVVVAVFNSSMLVSWNAARPCVSHLENAFRMCRLLLGEGGVAVQHTLGIASGTAISGDIGTHSQRFVTTVGPCMRLADALSLHAKRVNTRVLHAAVPGYGYCAAEEPALREMVRPVDVWVTEGRQQQGGGGARVVVYEVALDDCCFSRAFWDAFEARDAPALRKEVNEYDKLGMRAVQMIEQGVLGETSVYLDL